MGSVRKAEQLEQISDEQLMAEFCAGDQAAFGRLVQKYERELYNFLLKFLGQSASAEDVFQEAFLQVHISADKFEHGRRFRPWLYTIAANKARDFLRRKSRRSAIQLSSEEDEGGYGKLWDNLVRDETTPDAVFAQEQEKELVQAAVARLPDHLREILVLAYFQGFAYKEMAEMLSIPLGTVKSRLHAAVGRFAKEYSETQGETEG